MTRWSKKRAETWMRAFIKEHQVVPSSSLRRTYGGPPDEELLRHWGSVKRALQDSGAPLAEAAINKGSGTDMRYYQANGVITGTRARELRQRQVFPILVKCALCDWKEFHVTAEEGLQSQSRHLKKHGKIRKKRRWRNGPNKTLAGQIPGVRNSAGW